MNVRTTSVLRRPRRGRRRTVQAVAVAAAALVAGCSASATADPVGPTGGGGASGTPTTLLDRPVNAVAGCPVFAPDSVWHSRVETLPVDSRSAGWIAHLGGISANVRANIGSVLWQGSRPGLPVNVVDSSKVPMQTMTFSGEYGPAASYNGPYPVFDGMRVEGDPGVAWDQHVLLVDTKDCSAYELFLYQPWARSIGRWYATNGARWSLSDGTRPGPSVNAAGTPHIAGVPRLEEVRAGRVDHLLHACSSLVASDFTWPARASDGAGRPGVAPPMGARLRLRAGVDPASFPGQAGVLARAMREHGVLLNDSCHLPLVITADNPGAGWNDAEVATLNRITLADFEFVDQGPLRISDLSWRTR